MIKKIIFQIRKWLKGDDRGHFFTDEEREMSNRAQMLKKIENRQLRMMNEKIKHIEQMQKMDMAQERLRRMEEDYYGEEEEEEEEEEFDNPEDKLLSRIIDKCFPDKEPKLTPKVLAGMDLNATELEEEEIREKLSQIKKSDLKMFSELPRIRQENILRRKFPNLTDRTISKIVTYIPEYL